MTVYDEILAELKAIRTVIERMDKRDAIVRPTHLDREDREADTQPRRRGLLNLITPTYIKES